MEDLGGGVFGCRYCRLQFSTTHEAMARHICDHVEDNYIKLAQVTKVGKHSGRWRPEWHERNGNTGVWGHGGNAVYKKFVIPHNTKIKNGHLSCRTCGVTKKGWEFFGKEVTDQMRAIRINKVREHERGCRKKLNTAKKRSKISRISARIEIKSFNV